MKIAFYKLFGISGCFVILLVSCKSSSQPVQNVSCIASKIEALKNEPVANPPSQVWKWETEGQTFYYVNAACCDHFSTLYNENCNIVCAPDGGITGRGDGKCPEFPKDTKRTLIWKDTRK